MDSGEGGNAPFHAAPKPDFFEHRVQPIRERAVVGDPRQAVMDGVMLWGLDEAKPLHGSDDPREFLGRGVRPTVNGVHVHPKQHQKEKLPTKKAQQRPNAKD
jgi:hypothetical protein